MHECDSFQDVALDKKCRNVPCVVTSSDPGQLFTVTVSNSVVCFYLHRRYFALQSVCFSF